MNKKEWIRLAGSLGLVNLFSIFLGFIYNSGIARFYGAKSATDAYVVAVGLPELLGSIFLLTTLPSIITPIFAEAKESGGEGEAWGIISQIMTFVVILGLLVSALVVFSAERVVPFLSPGLREATLSEAVRMTKILFPTLIFAVLKSILLALLNLKGRFTLPSAVAVLGKAFQVLLLFFFGARGQIDLLVALVWLDAIVVAVAYWFLLSDRGHIRWNLGWSPKLKSALGSAALLTFITFLGELHGYSYRWFGSFLPEGSIALYYYAGRFMPLALSFFSLLVGRPLLPILSMACAKRDWPLLQKEMRKAFRVTLLLLVPMLTLFWVGRDAMLTILFYHGKFGREDLGLLSRLLLFLLPAIGAQCVAALFSSVLFAGRWIAQQAIVVVAMVGVLLAGMAVGVVHWGVLGLAAATTVSSLVTLILSGWIVGRRTAPILSRMEYAWVSRLILVGITFSAVAKAASTAIGMSPWIHPWKFLSLAAGIFALIYPLGLHWMRISEFQFLLQEIFDKVSGRLKSSKAAPSLP